jgi:hypothetical protein
MPKIRESQFDQSRYKWREVKGEPDQSYKIRHDYTILGYDLAAGTLDMVVRWAGDGGHCPMHRHTATTTVLVLEGEQHLWDLHPDGSRGAHKVRRAGDYALMVGEPLPHLERGGAEGGLAFFGNHSNDGRLYEIVDEELNLILDVTIEGLVADFETNT